MLDKAACCVIQFFDSRVCDVVCITGFYKLYGVMRLVVQVPVFERFFEELLGGEGGVGVEGMHGTFWISLKASSRSFAPLVSSGCLCDCTPGHVVQEFS